VRDLLPGYPYIAKSREEFLAMALHVHKNHEDVYEKVMRATAEKIRAMYSIPKFVESTLGVLTNKPQ
jgi:hypothetical protein